MQTLDLTRSQSVAEIQGHYEKLYRDTTPFQIRLPASIENSTLCARGDLIQFIMTWAIRYPTAGIATYLTEEWDQEGLDNLFDQDFGFLAALCSQTHGLLPERSFHGVKDRVIPKDVQIRSFSNMHKMWGDFRTKNLHSFFFVDDWLEQKNPLAPFSDIYRRKVKGEPSSARRSFIGLIEQLLENATRAAKRQGSRSDSFHEFNLNLPDLAPLFYEMIENADRWGRRDFNEKSIRGAVIHFHIREKNQPAISERQHGSPVLESFLRSHLDQSGTPLENFLEVSIFDNGLGLSERYSGNKSTSATTQYRNTLSCFMRWCGSSAKENEGQGLYRVIKALNNLGGLLRYRCGNLSLYRDFKNEPLLPERMKELENIEMETPSLERFSEVFWFNDIINRNRKVAKHPHAVGAQFTFVIPLKLSSLI